MHIREFVVAVNQDAAKIPNDTPLAPQQTTRCLDITSTQVFIGVTSKRPIELALLCNRHLGVVPVGTHGSFDAVLLRVLMALQYMNRYWKAKEGLKGNKTVAGYCGAVEQFVSGFVALGWQPAI